MKLCSACLLGIPCRFDGNSKPNQKVLELAKKEILMPICPEQLGGLPTPRLACEINLDGKVINSEGTDLTENFVRGANEALKIAQTYNISQAILKQKSPSCGCGKIYDGSFGGKIIQGNGITADLLIQNGIEVISEEDL